MPARKNQKKNKQIKNKPNTRSNQPPQLDLRVRFLHTFRFQVGAGVTARAIDRVDLLGLLASATSPTAATSQIEAIKIHYIKLWSIGANSTTTLVNSGVTWSGLASGQDCPVLMSETTLGVSNPSELISTPPRGSLASFWISKAAASTIFTVTAPANTTIDLHVTVIMANGQSGAVTSYVSSGLTAGLIYFGQLDKQSGSAAIVPTLVSFYG